MFDKSHKHKTMSTQTVEAPPPKEVPATVNAKGDAEHTHYWRSGTRNRVITFVTMAVAFREHSTESLSDILPSRAAEQEVLDLLDAPPSK